MDSSIPNQHQWSRHRCFCGTRQAASRAHAPAGSEGPKRNFHYMFPVQKPRPSLPASAAAVSVAVPSQGAASSTCTTSAIVQEGRPGHVLFLQQRRSSRTSSEALAALSRRAPAHRRSDRRQRSRECPWAHCARVRAHGVGWHVTGSPARLQGTGAHAGVRMARRRCLQRFAGTSMAPPRASPCTRSAAHALLPERSRAPALPRTCTTGGTAVSSASDILPRRRLWGGPALKALILVHFRGCCRGMQPGLSSFLGFSHPAALSCSTG